MKIEHYDYLLGKVTESLAQIEAEAVRLQTENAELVAELERLKQKKGSRAKVADAT